MYFGVLIQLIEFNKNNNMCTVTYIPTKNNEFIFTSNRDEAPKRSASEIVQLEQNEKTLLFPQDAIAKGTWIAISNSNQLVCILNGAFVKHERNIPYRMSRGIMALDFFNYKNALDFFEKFDFQGLESFTMIIFDDGTLYEFRWDESQKHIKKLDTSEKYIWSSCTLYTPEWQAKRQEWFATWQKENTTVNQNTILDFHKNGGEGHPNFDIIMKWKNIVRTTSITSIFNQKNKMEMRFEDLSNGTIINQELKTNSNRRIPN